jgi:hypothetical protein
MIMDISKPARRIVTIDDSEGKSLAIADGPSPDTIADPARPGFSSTRIWVTSASPVTIQEYRDAVTQFPRSLKPPRNGSLCRIVTLPPDATFLGKVGSKDVNAFFHAARSPLFSIRRKSTSKLAIPSSSGAPRAIDPINYAA